MNRRVSGYTLMEVLVALIFVGLLSIGLLVYAKSGMRGNASSDRFSTANRLLESTVERMKVEARNGTLSRSGNFDDSIGLPKPFTHVISSWSPWAADTSLDLVDAAVTVYWTGQAGTVDSAGVKTLMPYRLGD